MSDLLMKIIQRRDVIRDVLRKWREQYPDPERHTMRGRVGDVEDALAKLDLESCSPADIDAAGAPRWGSLLCDCCHTDVPQLIRFGDEPDWEARWQDLCLGCLLDGTKRLGFGNKTHTRRKKP